jgi:hypothetical protein
LSKTSLVRTEGYNTLRRKFGGDSFLVNGPYHAIMSALAPTGAGAGGVYDLFNFGTKNENDQGGPWSPDWGQQPHPPTPQTLRHLLAATASRALFDNGQQQAEQLLAQPLQQQQQQQQFFYSPTPPGQFAGWPSFNVFSFFLSFFLSFFFFRFVFVFFTSFCAEAKETLRM